MPQKKNEKNRRNINSGINLKRTVISAALIISLVFGTCAMTGVMGGQAYAATKTTTTKTTTKKTTTTKTTTTKTTTPKTVEKKPLAKLTLKPENYVTGIKLTWSRDSYAKGYYVYRKADNSTKWVKIRTFKSNKTLSCLDTKTYNGRKYTYKVKSYKDKKIRRYSYSKVIYRVNRPEIVSLTRDKKSFSVATDLIKRMTRYEVQYSTDKNFENSEIISLPNTDIVNTTVSDLQYDTKYYVRVFAYVDTEDGSFTGKCSKTKSIYLKYDAPPTYTDNKYAAEVVNLANRICDVWPTEYQHMQSKGELNENGKYGFDCSGFVSYVMNHTVANYVKPMDISTSIIALHDMEAVYNHGIDNEYKIETLTRDDMDLTNLQSILEPGDIIFFQPAKGDTDTRAYNHCGIYVGNNQFIHSTSYKADGVTRTELSGSYLSRVFEIKKYVPKEIVMANTETTVVSDKYSNVSVYNQCDDIKANRVDMVKVGSTVKICYRFRRIYLSGGAYDWCYIEYDQGKFAFIPTERLDIYPKDEPEENPGENPDDNPSAPTEK